MTGKIHRIMSWLIHPALRDCIPRQEQEQLRWQETLQAIESVAQGKVVHDWLRSWGSAKELPAPKVGQ